MFEILYKDSHQKSQQFVKYQEQHGSTVYAYHGTPIENIFTITHNGLTTKYAKDTSLFGSGIYFALDHRVAENFFSMGVNAWKNSVFQGKFGGIFGCEVVDNNKNVRYVGSESSPPSSPGPNSPGKKNYVVVNDEEFCRIKHLMIVTAGTTTTSKKNPCLYLLIIYIMILGFVAILRSFK